MISGTIRLAGSLVALALSASSLLAQTVAFPGALGFGAYATGGRNGTVFHVTTLTDTYPTITAGSFRDAVSHSGRTVVFDVGGTINLVAAVTVSGSITIAGQTAPGGICFNAGEMGFSDRANIICRFIRIRPGSNTASTDDDCVGFSQTTNCILDHMSMEFGPWNNIDAVTANNITVQNCIDANPIGQQFGAHTENVGAFYSWQYNIFANSHNRNPLAKINDTFINNLEYNNAAGYTTHTSTPFKHDIVNNYFIAGPASGGDFPWYQVDKNQSIYYSGNFYDSDKNGALSGSTTTPYWYQGVGTVLSAPWSSWTTVIPTMSPDLAYRYDMSTAGAFPRDDVDSLLLSQIQTLGSGTSGTGAGTSGPGGGLYTSQSQTGLSNSGYGTDSGLTAITDTDGDGMPDYWELATGSNPNVANPLTNTITGYTPLENYLNFLAAPHAVTQTNVPVDLNLRQFTTGFAASATFSLTNATNGTVSLLNGTNAHFIPTVNFTGLGGFTFTVTEGTYSLSASVTVCITPVTPPTAASVFNGALITVATNSAASSPASLPSNLLWRGDGTANAWNTTTSNFLKDATASLFKNGDVVTFDDTGSASPAINLTTTVSPGAILFNDNQNYTLAGSGSLSGTAALSKTGTGTLTVTATNSAYSGVLNVNGGALVVGPSASIGTGSFNLSGGATLSTSLGGNLVTIPGAVTVTAGNSATLGSGGQFGNEYSGNIASGDTNSVLYLNNGVSFNSSSSSSQFSGFTGTINIPSGSTLRFALASSGNTFGSLNPSFVVNGTLQPRNGGNTVKLGSISGSGTLTGQQTQPGSNNSGGVGNIIYNIGGNNLDSTFSGTFIDSNPTNLTCLVKSGTGKLTLTGSSTATGSNAVTAGILLINGSSASLQTSVSANATLGGTGVINGPVTVSSGGVLSPGGAGVGTLTINGGLTDNSPVFNYTLSSSPSGANDLITMSGTLAMTGAQMFNFTLVSNALGAGTYNLIQGATSSTASSVTLTNNLPGNTRQTLTMARPAAGSNPSYIQLNVSGTAASLVWSGANGGTWDLVTTANWLNGGSPDVFYNLDGVTFNDSGVNTSLTLATNVDPASILVNAAQNYTFSGTGSLFGNGTLTKTGAGTLAINTVNSAYTGNIFLNTGTLAFGSGAGAGSGSLILGGGTTLSLPNSGSSVFLGGTVTVPAGQTANISSGLISSGFSGNFVSGDSNAVVNLAGGFSFSGNNPQLDGFTGTINLQAGGTLRFSANSSGNTYGSYSPTFVINGTLQPRNAGNTVELGAFSGSGMLAGPQSNSGTGDTLYVIGGNNAPASFGGNISSNNAVPGSQVILSKIGTGTLTLTGASTFTGGTTITAGRLAADCTTGSATGSGDLEVFSGAALTGYGIIASATTIDNGATLAPGDPVGTLTISNNLTLNDNSLLQFGLGTNSDSIAVSGDIALTGQLTVTNSGGFGPGTYPLFRYSGALNYGNLVLVSAPTGYNYTIDTSNPGLVNLIVSLPYFGAVNLTGGSLTLSGSNGTPFNYYHVLQSSNLVTWTAIATNQFDANGGFSFTTNAPASSPQNFFRLQLQ